jgi:hypothetical protein
MGGGDTMNREQWLDKMTDCLRKGLFKRNDLDIPEVHVSTGFPSRKALGKRNRTIGQCWDGKASGDNLGHVFISPVLSDPMEVVETLAHELVHATVGTAAGHRKPFKDAATAIGLEGKMTATHGGDRFKALVQPYINRLGEYPQPAFDPTQGGPKKQTTRLIKAECDECGLIVRITRTHIDRLNGDLRCCDRDCNGNLQTGE